MLEKAFRCCKGALHGPKLAPLALGTPTSHPPQQPNLLLHSTSTPPLAHTYHHPMPHTPCRSLGCLDAQCVLCEHNPHRRCSVNFAPKYLVNDLLKVGGCGLF